MRPEYERLAGEFARLASGFGHTLAAAARADIATLLAAIDGVDRYIDEITDGEARRAAWQAVLAVLDGAAPPAALPGELTAAVAALRRVCERRGVTRRIVRLVRREQRTSEALRSVTDGQVYVRLVLCEGETTAALALVLVEGAYGPAFRGFFQRLAGPANLVDKLLDVAGDHARGEVRVRPGAGLYARLAWALTARLPGLTRRAGAATIVRLGWTYLLAQSLRAARKLRA